MKVSHVDHDTIIMVSEYFVILSHSGQFTLWSHYSSAPTQYI